MTENQEKWNKEIDNYIDLSKTIVLMLLAVIVIVFTYYAQGKTITFNFDSSDSNIWFIVFLCLYICTLKGFVDIVGNILGAVAWIVKQTIYAIKHKDEFV